MDWETLKTDCLACQRCPLHTTRHNVVFGQGVENAEVLFVGEGPGQSEDEQGLPFVGRSGQLLDKYLFAIDLDRASNCYIANIVKCRPPQNRDPSPDEIAMMLPFVRKHVELVDPDVLVLMGNHSCQAMLGRKGITRLRGKWAADGARPVLPMFHPAYLLRNPVAKRDAWHDLLMLQAKLRDTA